MHIKFQKQNPSKETTWKTKNLSVVRVEHADEITAFRIRLFRFDLNT
jgi:hypothetical protein